MKQRVIMQAKKGKCEAFGRLVDDYHQDVYLLCFRMVGDAHEAEVLAKDIFVKAYLTINNYSTEEKFLLWLYHIVVDFIVAHLQDNPKGTQYEKSNRVEAYDMPDMENGQFEGAADQNVIQQAIMALSFEQRLAITLQCIARFSLTEIGDLLGVPVSTIQTYTRQGREMLHKQVAFSVNSNG